MEISDVSVIKLRHFVYLRVLCGSKAAFFPACVISFDTLEYCV
jgi:hypothetical protein